MSYKAELQATESLVFDKIETILLKPRVSAYTPQSLVEIVYNLLDLIYPNREYEKFMYNEYYGSGSRSWWLQEDLDYPTAVARLQKLVSYLQED